MSATTAIKVSKQFLNDFSLVTKHYDMPEAEVAWLKDQARKKYALVSKSLRLIAEEIRSGSLN